MKNAIFASSLVLGIFLVILFVMYYFMSLRQVNRRKSQYVSIHERLKPGCTVEFAGGFIGKLRKVTEEYCEVEIAKDTIVTISRFSISRIIES